MNVPLRSHPLKINAYLFPVVLVSLAIHIAAHAQASGPVVTPSAASADELGTLNQIQGRYQAVHEQVSPAVVAVQCRGQKASGGFYGTGVVITPTGLVLTSCTVVPPNTSLVQVLFTDGRVMDAKVIETDNVTETCALQIVRADDKNPLPYVELCDSSKVRVGELAYTAGNPFHTISRDGQVAWSVGTISGVYKIASADEQSHYNGLVLETDAAVNPGSDGGSLIDGNGRLLGVLSLCFCESRWLGTAIPAHLIKNSLAVLKNVPLVDPKTPARFGSVEDSSAARAIPEALIAASRPAMIATVKVVVHRNFASTTMEHKGSLVSRLKQRPDAPVTGVIIDSDGYVLTSAFNVEGEIASIDVLLSDGTTMPATLLGRNLGLDLAVLRVTHPKGLLLPAIPLAGEPDLKIGRFIAILGYSEDGPPTHTVGIVSAIGRFDGSSIQTDALTNYGNSGGPVVDLDGRLVGIASQVRTHTDWSENSGVGFFTSSDRIIQSLADLKAGRDIKAPSRPFLGVSPVESATEVRGVKLEEVIPSSAAANARLQPGDVIIAVDGMDTHSWPALVRVLKAHKAGDNIEITYQRGSVTTRTQTILTTRKDVR